MELSLVGATAPTVSDGVANTGKVTLMIVQSWQRCIEHDGQLWKVRGNLVDARAVTEWPIDNAILEGNCRGIPAQFVSYGEE